MPSIDFEDVQFDPVDGRFEIYTLCDPPGCDARVTA